MVTKDLVMRGDIKAGPLGVNPLMRRLPPGRGPHAGPVYGDDAKRAAAVRASARRFGRIASMRLLTSARISGGAVSGRPELKGGAGAYSRPSCSACQAGAGKFGRNHQREVHAGGDTAAGNDIAVTHDAVSIGDATEQRQHVTPGPMAGGALAVQQAGGAENKRAGTDRRQIAGAGGEAAHLRHESRVVDRFRHREAAGEEDQIAAIDLCQPARAGENKAALRFNRPAGFRGDNRLGVGNAAENRMRCGEVELSHARINRFNDAERAAGHGVSLAHLTATSLQV